MAVKPLSRKTLWAEECAWVLRGSKQRDWRRYWVVESIKGLLPQNTEERAVPCETYFFNEDDEVKLDENVWFFRTKQEREEWVNERSTRDG